MIEVTKFAKKKISNGSGNSTSGGFAGTIINNSTNINANPDGVYLWGQYHDHTADINGDLTSTGTVKANQIEANSATISGTVSANHISTNSAEVLGGLSAGTIHSSYADITTIDNGTLNSDLVKASTVSATTLSAITAYINTLFSTNITTDYLTVTKAAHFFKLIIDEIKASQGQIIITPANAKIDKVVTQSNGDFKCYFRAKDEERKIYQSFEINDQVVCQTFNAATGTSYNVSNKYYWRLCTQVSQTVETTTIDGQNVDCHWIILSNTDKDSECISVPEAGDEIVMLGNRSDSTRQAAITIGAYNNPYLDSGLTAPFLVQYDGNNNYNLSTHRVNIISNGLNQFKGKFSTNSGDDIEQLIDDVSQGALTYVHQAYANSSDGRQNFSKTYFNNAQYVGYCSNHTASDSALTYNDYTWCRLKGEDGTNADGYKLVPIQEMVAIDANSTVGVNIRYNILHTVGTTTEVITASTSGYYVRFKPYKVLSYAVNYTNLSVNTTTPYYTNASYETNWKSTTDHLVYLEVQLVDSSENIYDRRIVYAVLTPAASLTITDNITATVQGNYNQLSGDIATNTNAISTLQQNYDSISQTVSSHTTSINTLSGTVVQNTTDIGNLTVRADGISSQVSKLSGTQLLSNWWTKPDLTAASYDEAYQQYDIDETTWHGNTYYDVYSNVIRLEDSNSYVFSFYSEFNPSVYVVYSSTNGNPANFNTYISTVRHWDSSDTYMSNPRIYYTFSTTQTGYYAINVSYTEELAGAFARPQLEVGDMPTSYDVNGNALESEIKQTADEIYLGVGNTGIDITNGKINLNSTNTTINGNLRINNVDSGFELYDNNTKVIQIDNDAIGAFDYKEFMIDYLSLEVSTAVETESGMAILGDNGSTIKQLYANTVVDFTQLFVMSTMPNNATVKLKLWKNTRSVPSVTNYPSGDAIDQDWELVSAFTKSQTTSSNYVDFLGSDQMLHIPITETAYYCFTYTVDLNSYTERQYYSLAGNYYINQTTYTHIAADGIQLRSPNDASLYMSDDAFILRFKDNELTVGYNQNLGNDTIKLKNKNVELKVFNNKITAQVGSHLLEFNENEILENTYPVKAKKCREESATAITVGKNDEFIIITNSQSTTLNVNGSAAKYNGHTFIVKHKNGNSVSVTGSVMDYDSGTVITNKSWNDKVPRQFTYLNGVWYIMKLG